MLFLKDPIKREWPIISGSGKLNGELTGLRAFVGPSTWFKLLIHMILRTGEEGKFTKNCSEHGVDIKKNSEEFFKLTPNV